MSEKQTHQSIYEEFKERFLDLDDKIARRTFGLTDLRWAVERSVAASKNERRLSEFKDKWTEHIVRVDSEVHRTPGPFWWAL